MSNTPWGALVQRQARTDNQRENTGRLAFSLAEGTTTGWGDMLLPDQVTFDVDYIEMPHLMHSCYVDGDDLVPTAFPRVTAGIYRWNVNARGLYVGAWVFVTVDVLALGTIAGTPPDYTIEHMFTFVGTALKWGPADALVG